MIFLVYLFLFLLCKFQAQGNSVLILIQIQDYIYQMRSTFIFGICILIAINSVFSQDGYGYLCNVPNCQVCSYFNFCGLCNPNYILQLNYTTSHSYCQKVICNITNCAYCYQNNVCAFCKPGFFLSTAGLCIDGNQTLLCSSGCIACSSSYCTICQYGYLLKDGVCQKKEGKLISNCQSAFSKIACQLCQPYFIVAPSYKCIQAIACPIPNCYQCGFDGYAEQYICLFCLSGFTPEYYTRLSCIPNQCKIDFCVQCQSYNQCMFCQEGFYINQNFSCSLVITPCNIPNCALCINAEECAKCQNGYEHQCFEITNVCICNKLISSSGGIINVTNCLEYNYMTPGTSQLYIGCIICQPNFINVGGYCVANLTLSSYQCNVSNCLYCVQNNVCGQCIPGYTVYFGATSTCFKNYSPVPKCQLAPIGLFYNYNQELQYLYINYCSKCSPGFILSNNAPYCILETLQTCNITNCEYCHQNNICSRCLNPFSLINNTCISSIDCQIENCAYCAYCDYCENNITCQFCNSGFYLSNNTCLNGFSTYQNLSYCIVQFDPNCANCSYFQCISCVQGYSLKKNIRNTFQFQQCCPSPIENIPNCNKYLVQWKQNCSSNVICTECKIGTILFFNKQLCISLPCSIPNCLYCYGSSTCAMCDENYTLSNGTCTPYQKNSCPSNCISCNNQSICLACLNGYILYNGNCVCPMQNCLQCIGNAFCTLCAFPTIATYGSSSCLPPAAQNIECQVQNCLNCLNINICAVCNYGYSLQINGSCKQNSCGAGNNCSLCSQDQTICYLCNQGYFPASYLGAQCSPLDSNYSCNVIGCVLCSNSTLCQVCSPYYYLSSNGSCQPYICFDNCVVCLSNSSCLFCQNGFSLANNNTCILTPSSTQDAPCATGKYSIFACVACSGLNSSLCLICQWGFIPSTDGLSCLPQSCSILNCQVCLQNETFNNGFQLCLVCKQGFLITSNFQCIPYPQIASVAPNCSNSYNCLYCAQENYCDLCAGGWNSINGICVTTYGCSVKNCQSCSNQNVCYSCYQNYVLNNNICVAICVQNCFHCSSSTTCSLCFNNFILSSNNTQCQCPTSNGFVLLNNTCICPNQFTQFGSKCYLCSVSSCLLCSSDNYCYNCEPNFYNNNGTCECNSPLIFMNDSCQCPQGQTYFNNSCYSCIIQNCILCQSNGICSVCNGTLTPQNGGLNCGCNSITSIQNGTQCICQQGYFFDTISNTCLQCNIDSCLFCGSGIYGPICVQCLGNTVSDEVDGQCLCQFNLVQYNQFCYLCNVFNCLTCSSDNLCINCLGNLTLIGNQCLCINGYYFNFYNQECFACNIQGCSTCVSLGLAGMCSECLTGYFLNNGLCTLCTYPCAVCNASASCLVCQFPFSSTPAQNGTCYTCSTPFCSTCNIKNTFQCLQCIQGYSLNSGNCKYSSACSIQCTNCLQSKVCLSCMNGYTVNILSPAQCLVCSVINCATCQSSNINTCLLCLSGYYINQNGLCVACPFSICQTCNQTQCLTFQPSTGLFPLDINNTIIPFSCDGGCQNCSSINPVLCLNCYLGYTLSASNTCIPCAYPCLTCASGNPTLCLSCYGNLALINNTICQACTQSLNCLTCFNNASLCQSCPNGFYLNDGICQAECPPNCISCSSNSTCIQCASGFSLNPSGLCLPCLYNCRICSGTNQGICLQCGEGFYLSNIGNSQFCNPCSQFCLECGQLGCSSCMTGYYLTSIFTCTPTCNHPCATCSLSNPSFCNTCIFGYVFEKSTSSCMPDTQCSLSSSCQYCPQGFVLDQNICVLCPEGSNCSRCEPLTNSTCLSCLNGYYLNSDSLCSQCPSGCQTCSNQQNCLSCNIGYALVNQPVSSSGTCSLCSFPCSQCSGVSTTCTSCVEGYLLSGWNCLSKFNFGFFISLDTNLTVFYDNYAQFLNAIVGSNINYPNITVTKILAGSVNVTGNISTNAQTGSNKAANQYNSYKSILSTPTIAGMKILTSSLTVNGGSLPPSPQPGPVPPTPQNNSNLAIILGICIPIGLIIIVIAIYFIVIKRFCMKKPSEQKYGGENTTVREQFEMESI